MTAVNELYKYEQGKENPRDKTSHLFAQRKADNYL